MMDSKDQQAFPAGNPTHGGHAGMTLRDYFAGKALANMASFHAGDAFDPKNVSKAAYQYADAMLQARSKSDG